MREVVLESRGQGYNAKMIVRAGQEVLAQGSELKAPGLRFYARQRARFNHVWELMTPGHDPAEKYLLRERCRFASRPIVLNGEDISAAASRFICDDYPNVEAVISGVKDIYAEHISDQAQVRDYTRQQLRRRGKLTSKKRRGAEENPTFEVYLEFECPVERLRPHQVLAIRRGDAEKAISYSFDAEDERILDWIKRRLNTVSKPQAAKAVDEAIEDGYKRLLLPTISRDIWSELESLADNHAIESMSRASC